MNGEGNVGTYSIYPKRYFDASPTWFVWNKLTAADVHSLREERGFEGQNVYFWLNHPIQYVRLVGVVSGIDTILNGKFTLLTLDDSSGANIEVKIIGRESKPDDVAEYPSNTEVDNLDVVMSMGLPRVFIDRQSIDVGTVVRAQGSIMKFRNIYQLVLKRIRRVQDTNEEVIFWSSAADWKRSVLARPWVLTEEESTKIDVEIQRREQIEHEKSEARRQFSAQAAKKMQRHAEKREAKRQKREEQMNAGALDGSGALRMPWD